MSNFEKIRLKFNLHMGARDQFSRSEVSAMIDLVDELTAATRLALDTADSWHEFHSGSNIHCDELCAIREKLRKALGSLYADKTNAEV